VAARHRELAHLPGHPRNPEIEHFHERSPIEALGDEEVVRFQIPMNDVVCVSLADAVECLKQIFDGLRGRESASALEDLFQIFPFEKLHHDERLTFFGRPDVVDSNGVLASEACRRPPFPIETLDDARIGRERAV
jgi:hypothetical protein